MSKTRKIVLVVDDDTAMLKSVRRLLQQHDYEPILFSSAEDFKIILILTERPASFSTSTYRTDRGSSLGIGLRLMEFPYRLFT